MRYLYINLTNIQGLYKENYTTLMKETKEEQLDGEINHCDRL